MAATRWRCWPGSRATWPRPTPSIRTARTWSGLEFKAATDLGGSFNAMRGGGPDPVRQGQLALDAMGPRARVLPVLVFHGSADGIVSTVNGHQVLSQWAQTNDLADDGSDKGSVSDVPGETRSGQVPGGRTFTHARYRDGAGRVVLEKYIVDGMNHAWPDGSGGSYSDPHAPSGAELGWAFLRDHPLRGDSDGGATGSSSPSTRAPSPMTP